VTKAAKEAERAKKMADKVNAFALQQKAKATEASCCRSQQQQRLYQSLKKRRRKRRSPQDRSKQNKTHQ
jgi:hypothetical protein